MRERLAMLLLSYETYIFFFDGAYLSGNPHTVSIVEGRDERSTILISKKSAMAARVSGSIGSYHT